MAAILFRSKCGEYGKCPYYLRLGVGNMHAQFQPQTGLSRRMWISHAVTVLCQDIFWTCLCFHRFSQRLESVVSRDWVWNCLKIAWWHRDGPSGKYSIRITNMDFIFSFLFHFTESTVLDPRCWIILDVKPLIISPKSSTVYTLYAHVCLSIGNTCCQYNDVTIGAMASQITRLTIVYSAVYSSSDQRKHQSSASLAFVQGFHRGPVNSSHIWPETRKMFSFDDVIMVDNLFYRTYIYIYIHIHIHIYIHRP